MSVAEDDDHIRAVAKATVKELMLTFGIDVSRPDAVQAFQRDLIFLRDFRVGTAGLKSAIIRRVAGAICLAIIGWALLGFRSSIH